MQGLFRQTPKFSLVAWTKCKSLITIICGMTMKRYVQFSFYDGYISNSIINQKIKQLPLLHCTHKLFVILAIIFYRYFCKVKLKYLNLHLKYFFELLAEMTLKV